VKAGRRSFESTLVTIGITGVETMISIWDSEISTVVFIFVGFGMYVSNFSIDVTAVLQHSVIFADDRNGTSGADREEGWHEVQDGESISIPIPQ
jgi:hypothetical protein